MIRFIHIGDQIDEKANDFAFFDTVTERFRCFDDQQVFSNVNDFIDAYASDDGTELKRYLSLIPTNYK